MLKAPPRVNKVWEGEGGVKGVIKLSEKLEKKPWRRK